MIIGGLVFTRLTIPLCAEFADTSESRSPSFQCALLEQTRRWKQRDDEEVIILLDVLRHEINEGIENTNLRLLRSMQGYVVKNLAELVVQYCKIIQDNNNKFLCLGFAPNHVGTLGAAIEEVLLVEDLMPADSEILNQHRISSPVSSDLVEVYEQNLPEKNNGVCGWLRGMRLMSASSTGKRRRKTSAYGDESAVNPSEALPGSP